MASRRAQKDLRKQMRAGAPSESFRHKMELGAFAGKQVRVTPPGQEKMSEVLKEFVEPYVGFLKSKATYRMLLDIGVIAWNAALFPVERRQAELRDGLSGILPPDAVDLKADFLSMVEALIARKDAHFASIRRLIVSFEFSEEDSYLAVASLLVETPEA